MGSFFVNIYDFFSRHKLFMWFVLIVSVVIMTLASLNVRYEEDITNFFPKHQNDISQIFQNLKEKDKIAVMFSTKNKDGDVDALIDCAEEFGSVINSDTVFSANGKLSLSIDASMIEEMSDFVYENLPVFLNDAELNRLDSITSPEAIAARMKQNYNNLFSPIGGFVTDYIYRDPLGIGGEVMRGLQEQGNNFQYTIVDNYIFSPDKNTLIAYIDLKSGISSGVSDKLIDIIEASVSKVGEKHTNIDVEYFGAPAVAAYNARQIKTDSMVTLNIALLIVVIFITLAFKNKYSVLLVITPVLYGAIFALSIIYLIHGKISLIAIGSGSIVFGIALSYSIHILSHTNHIHDMRMLIRDLAYPLTIGSFTTIGAFAGLLFTNSKLLQDFGLFSSLTLVGTTLFALVFLPHFLSVKHGAKSQSRLLRFVEGISGMRPDRNRLLVGGVLVLTLICGIFFGNVGFDSNMMNINYDPPHLKHAQEKLNSFTASAENESNILFIASSGNMNNAAKEYDRLCTILNGLKKEGKILSYSSVSRFIVPDSLQHARIEKWNKFWSAAKQAEVLKAIDKEAAKLGFDDGAFSGFEDIAGKSYRKISYDNDSLAAKLFNGWISPGNTVTSFIAQVRLNNDAKSSIYEEISQENGIIAVDRAFFAGKMAEDVNNNFYLILYLSGFLIFFALLLSYGRIELTLMSFLPMFISWIIILGIMSIMGIEFNIVTIILSTFIFGIGDDFSIFIMDGLQSEYRDKTEVIAQHKTAIFFSAFTILVGMGALVFAKHPAMYSLGVISLIGILVVVLVAYIVQPFIFRVFISSQTKKGGFPYTLCGIINTLYAFGLFLTGCIFIKSLILLSYLVPIGKSRRKYFIHSVTSFSTHTFIKAMVTNKMININEYAEDFSKPAVVIANHQSFIDILMLLGLHKKFVMVANGWVWNSPFFGRIVRYLDFYHTANGYEKLAGSLKEKIAQGYSVIIFPEGTRSASCKIKRFHKGAFYLAEQLKLDIVPILIYGNGLVSSKNQPFYIKKGIVVSKILPRISYNAVEYGTDYKERAKNISQYFKCEYHKLYEEFNRASNPYYRDALIKNYIYKNPVLEWYMKVKLRLEKWYDTYDRLLPREGHIVDLGCGYGAMCYMLSMLSDGRHVTGVDYDGDKIALANNCFSKNDRTRFVHCDIREFDIPEADAFVISDVLHYLDKKTQETIIEKCIVNLNAGGIIIIRDGDASSEKRHSLTKKSEKWSTQIMKFNKTDGPLCFLSKESIIEIARRNSMSVEIAETGMHTSNTLFVLTQKK